MYLVQISMDDTVGVSLMSASEIINHVDMSDCYPPDFEMKVYEVYDFGKVIPLEIHGCWHDFDDPLHIEVTREDGTVVFDGYGTDH